MLECIVDGVDESFEVFHWVIGKGHLWDMRHGTQFRERHFISWTSVKYERGKTHLGRLHDGGGLRHTKCLYGFVKL